MWITYVWTFRKEELSSRNPIDFDRPNVTYSIWLLAAALQGSTNRYSKTNTTRCKFQELDQ